MPPFLFRKCAIHGLFFWCRPTAVTWFVVPVVVNSVKRPASRAIPHVCQEILELHPTLANLDPSASISTVQVVLLIAAPVFHGPPTSILRRIAFSMLSVIATPNAPIRSRIAAS